MAFSLLYCKGDSNTWSLLFATSTGRHWLIDRFLRDGLLASLPVHPKQHAYRPGRSTISALHQLVGRIEKALDAKHYALGVFFDVEGAFDNTSPAAVKESLRERRIHKSLVDWIVHLISMRSVIVRTACTFINALLYGKVYHKAVGCHLSYGRSLLIVF